MFDLKELKTLIAVIDESGFEAAAKALCLSTGAISQRIRGMEDSIGKALLVRSSPPKLTAAGEQVMQFARQVQLLHNDMVDAVSDQTTQNSLSIAVNHDSMVCWMMPVINRLIQEHQIFIDIRCSDNLTTQEMLKSGVVMGAITAQKKQVSGCKTRQLGALEYQVVCSKVFAEKYFSAGVTRAKLLQAPVLLYDREDKSLEPFLREYQLGIAPLAKHYIPGSCEMFNGVINATGWAAIPKIFLQDRADNQDLMVMSQSDIAVNLYWKTWDLTSHSMNTLTGLILDKSRDYLVNNR